MTYLVYGGNRGPGCKARIIAATAEPIRATKLQIQQSLGVEQVTAIVEVPEADYQRMVCVLSRQKACLCEFCAAERVWS